jgi:hypothetical protein
MFSTSALVAGVATLVGRSRASAQLTTQEVMNSNQITSTGNVNVEQSASGVQGVEVFVDGEWVSGDGIYRDGNRQVIVNDNQVTSTGDVNVRQAANGTQQVTTVVRYPERGGDRADVCSPGAVMANPNTGQLFFQANDCCWYVACASDCQKTCQTCEGGGRGK